MPPLGVPARCELWSRGAADDGRPSSSTGVAGVGLAELHVAGGQVNFLTGAGDRVDPVRTVTAREARKREKGKTLKTSRHGSINVNITHPARGQPCLITSSDAHFPF